MRILASGVRISWATVAATAIGLMRLERVIAIPKRRRVIAAKMTPVEEGVECLEVTFFESRLCCRRTPPMKPA